MDWANLIGQYGFQTVACVAMAWYVWYRGEAERADRKNVDEMHKQETDKMSDVINNNTIALTKLVDKLECKGSVMHENGN